MTAEAKKLNPDKVWCGFTPTSWSNDDFLDIECGTTLRQCASEMALAGYRGCSGGRRYPADIVVLKREPGVRKLGACGPWTSTFLTQKKIQESHSRQHLHRARRSG